MNKFIDKIAEFNESFTGKTTSIRVSRIGLIHKHFITIFNINPMLITFINLILIN